MRCSLFLPMFAAFVCQSVYHAVHLGFTVQKWLNRSRCCSGVNILGGPWNVVLDEGADRLQSYIDFTILPFGAHFRATLPFPHCHGGGKQSTAVSDAGGRRRVWMSCQTDGVEK